MIGELAVHAKQNGSAGRVNTTAGEYVLDRWRSGLGMQTP
jgi:hypothetical protein